MLIRFFGCSDCPSQGLACRPEVNQGRITTDAIPGGWYRVSPVMVTTRGYRTEFDALIADARMQCRRRKPANRRGQRALVVLPLAVSRN
jgi:hypothetical protein